MMLLVAGVNHRTASMELREALAFDRDKLPSTLTDLATRYGCETVLLSTCNRLEVYLGRAPAETGPDVDLLAQYLAEARSVPFERLRPSLYSHRGADAVRHLFRVVGSLDSLVLGEMQIAGQVKEAYEVAQSAGAVGPILHSLFQHARQVSKRIRSETGLAHGKASVSSLALDYLAGVFDHFGDKTVLVIGAGKMGELTLKHLRKLQPQRILVTNRSSEKAAQVAASCSGQALPFDQLDQALAAADIILSTTGAPEPIVSLERFERILPARIGRHVAIIDIAVPRDFDPRIAGLDLVDVLINVDDLQSIREKVLKSRLRHVPAAEAIVAAEAQRFLKEWNRRQTGPAIARLSQEWDAIRERVQAECLSKLNGKLSDEDRARIEGAFKLLQNKLLHTPISVLREGAHEESHRGLLEAVYKLFRLKD
jgi:glutamyl-tRNA reductase